MGCLCSTTTGAEQPLKKVNDESKLVMATLDTGWDLTDPSFETPQQIFARYESLMVQTRLGIVLDVLEASFSAGPTAGSGWAIPTLAVDKSTAEGVSGVSGVGATVAVDVPMTSYGIERVLGKALVNIANCIIQAKEESGGSGAESHSAHSNRVTNMTKDALLLFVAPSYASCLNEQRLMVEQAFSATTAQLTAISQFFYDCAVVMTQILMLTEGILMTCLSEQTPTYLTPIGSSFWQQHDDAVADAQQQVIYPALVATVRERSKGVMSGAKGAKDEKQMRVVCRGMVG